MHIQSGRIAKFNMYGDSDRIAVMETPGVAIVASVIAGLVTGVVGCGFRGDMRVLGGYIVFRSARSLG